MNFIFLFFIAILVHSIPFVWPQSNGNQCGVNFTSQPYVKIGECSEGGVQERMRDWDPDGFPKTLCCRNALALISQALASQGHLSTNPLFPSLDQWHNCNSSFHPQDGLSFQSCGFDNLYEGAGSCSVLRLRDIMDQAKYRTAADKCSHFDQPFNDVCSNCIKAIFELRDSLLAQFNVADDTNTTEKGICNVAALVSVAAARLPNDSSITDKVLRCLPQSDNDPGFSPVHGTHWRNYIMEAAFGLIVISLIIFLVRYVSKKKRPYKQVQLEEITAWSGLYLFSRAEIENAIQNGNERCLGRGSAGQVYKGVLPSGQVVAIKHLNKTNSLDSFTREVEGLSRLRHPNLVSLFGCCMEGGERYLVYEYCPKGNLAQHLLRRESQLKWETRVKILRDCAFALKYLHHHIEGCVIHRDIKLTNILLGENGQAKLSDFGLARMMGMEESKVFTDVRGTIGYMDPEYMSNAKLTCASDIYSFGIVALQILSGQKVIELDLDARDQLTRKAKDVSMGRRPLGDFEDPRLKGQVNKADFEAILQIAVLCVAKSSKGRPTIEVVFEELDNAHKNTRALKAKQDVISTSSTSNPKSMDL